MSIEIKDLSFIYNSGSAFEKKAVDCVTATIEKGELVGLIGHTGSGKSTLIQHLNALLKPTHGQILLNGEDIHADKKKLRNIRRQVGLVFQYPEHQLFEVSIYKDVAYGPENLGLSKAEVDRRVRAALQIVGIPEEIYEKSPFDISGGQKRRVAIAGVLAMEPEVLILDEPTAGLDPKGRDEILEELRNMHEKLKITVVLVSHSMEDIAKLVSRIFVMHHGKLVMAGNAAEVFKQIGYLEEIGLAAPQVSYLMQALNQRGFDLPEDIFTVDDAFEALRRKLMK